MITVPDSIGELRELMPSTVALDIMETILSITGEIQIECSRLSPKIDYDYLFGGTPKVVETFEDLKEITVLVEHESGRWCNITEAVGDLDIAKKLDDDWMFFVLCTNNAGGVGYYVPTRLIPSCPNLHLTILRVEENNG